MPPAKSRSALRKKDRRDPTCGLVLHWANTANILVRTWNESLARHSQRYTEKLFAFHHFSNIDLFTTSSLIELVILFLVELLQSFVADFFEYLAWKFLPISCHTSQTEASRIEQTTISMNTDRTRTHWTSRSDDQRGDFVSIFLVSVFHSHEWIAKQIDFLQEIDGQWWLLFRLGIRCGRRCRWRRDGLVDVRRIIPIIGSIEWTERTLKNFRFNEFLFDHLKQYEK